MPYPHSNDLGKNPPPGSSAAWTVADEKYKAKVLGSFEDLVSKEIHQISAEIKAEQQKKMMDQLFGSKPTTIKFPNVQPVQFKGDFPNHSAANKWGKPDLSAIPEQGPLKAFADEAMDQAALIQNLIKAGLISKKDAYASLYKGEPVVVDKEPKVSPTTMANLNEMLKDVYSKPIAQEYGKPQGDYVTFPIHKGPPSTNFYGFTKKATTLGDEQSYQIDMKFKIEGLAGCDDKVLSAHQLVSKEFIYGTYGKSATEKIVDDMLRQIKAEIMEQIKKAK